MASVDSLFHGLKSRIDALHSIVHPALADFCSKGGYLLTFRKKELPSLYEKLFTARYESLNQVDDLLAYSIVIDVSQQTQVVEQFLKSAFDVCEVRGARSLFDERFFDFDSTRVICKLGSSDPEKGSLNDVFFEVQIKTLLQFAWSKITHPLVYKPERYDAQKSRLAAETLAQLEAIDRTFQNFEKIAPTVKTVRRREMVACEKIANTLSSLIDDGVIPAELSPSSWRRLSECVFRSMNKQTQNNIEKLIPEMRNFITSLTPFPVSVSIFEVCLLFLFRSGRLDTASPTRPKYYYVSDEMKTLFPDIRGLAQVMSLTA